jgi:hypothetical protein
MYTDRQRERLFKLQRYGADDPQNGALTPPSERAGSVQISIERMRKASLELTHLAACSERSCKVTVKIPIPLNHKTCLYAGTDSYHRCSTLNRRFRLQVSQLNSFKRFFDHGVIAAPTLVPSKTSGKAYTCQELNETSVTSRLFFLYKQPFSVTNQLLAACQKAGFKR